MTNDLHKSLIDLIDETIFEIEELKKSRFSAAEVELKGPGEGIDGKPSNGKLDAAKAEDKKDEDDKDKEEKDKKDKAEKAEMEKGVNEEKSEKSESMDKKEDKKDDKKDEDKKDDKDEKGGEDHEKKERKAIGDLANLAGMKKSDEEMSSLMKSFVEERVKPLEDKLSTILSLVNKIADQPVPAKGATARTVPLMKSEDQGAEPLQKAQIASKLFELKKSGTAVDSLDVTKAEMGQELDQIVKKYKLS